MQVHDPEALARALGQTGGQSAQPPQQQVIIAAAQKNVALAGALAFFFGPIGLLYSSPIGAIVLFLLAFPVCLVTFGVGIVVIWIASLIWAIVAASNYNDKLSRHGL